MDAFLAGIRAIFREFVGFFARVGSFASGNCASARVAGFGVSKRRAAAHRALVVALRRLFVGTARRALRGANSGSQSRKSVFQRRFIIFDAIFCARRARVSDAVFRVFAARDANGFHPAARQIAEMGSGLARRAVFARARRVFERAHSRISAGNAALESAARSRNARGVALERHEKSRCRCAKTGAHRTNLAGVERNPVARLAWRRGVSRFSPGDLEKRDSRFAKRRMERDSGG